MTAKTYRFKRAAAKSAPTKFIVIDRDGGLHWIIASTGGLALERARHYGIDAVGVRQQTKGNEQ